MANWKYNPENYNANGFGLIPDGDYRVRIEEAEEKVSRTGKDMIQLTLKVSGYNSKIWFYLVFDNSNEQMTQMTDQRLGSIYDSFQIEPGNLNTYDWEGKVGGARIKQKADQNGNMRSEITRFLPRNKVDSLPAWLEGSAKSPQGGTINPEMVDFGDTSGESIASGDRVPF